MAQFTKTELKLEHKFDPRACRHYINGSVMVLHCHHFTSLYTQLADDLGMLDGKKLMADVAEDVFTEVLKSYYKEHKIEAVDDRISIAEQYYAACGLGTMNLIFAGSDSGLVDLKRSHVDEGWIKKWGKRDKPVNFFTEGYISAMFCAVFDRPPRSYRVIETASIVAGAEKSTFEVVAN